MADEVERVAVVLPDVPDTVALVALVHGRHPIGIVGVLVLAHALLAQEWREALDDEIVTVVVGGDDERTLASMGRFS